MKKLADVLARHAEAGGLPEMALAFLRRIRPLPRSEQIKRVNQFVNRLKYGSDKTTDGVRDRWQPPAVFYRRGRGDCEEFALMKALMLAWLGIEAWFVLCWDRQRWQWHAVAFARNPDKPGVLVLDHNPPFFPICRKGDYDRLIVYRFKTEHQYPIT